MKTRLFIFAGFLFISLFTFGQGNVNLVIFSEDGDKFYAFVNGIKQNNAAESNVKVTGVTPNISLRIEFEDKALPQLKQNMALEPGFEHTAKIKRDMKKQLKLRYFGSTPLNDASTNNVPTVAYHTVESSGTDNNSTATNNTSSGSNTNYTTTTQMNTNTNPNGAAVNVSIDPVNLNVNFTDSNTGIVTQSSTSTTVTSSSSTNSSPRSNHHHHNQQQQTNTNQTELQSTPTTAAGCRAAMTQPSFDKMKQSIEAKPFSDTKMSTAKIATKNNCISTSQVKEICKLFSMDDDKLTYAKFAYDYCVDKANYFQVSDVFSFSTTTDDLNKFLESH